MASTNGPAPFAAYLSCRDKVGRLRLLANMRSAGAFLPISLAEDLLCMELGTDEKLAILESVGSRDGRALEHFLTESLASWPQELATAAVRIWAQKTDHLLWFRILTALKSTHLPQRVFYTIVDHAFRTGGAQVLKVATEAEGLEEMSPAFHGLILHRAVQWAVDTERLATLARKGLKDLGTHLHPENKATPSALAYLARFHYEEVRELTLRPAVAEPWRDFVRALMAQGEAQERQLEKLTKLLAKPPKAKAAEKIASLWLPLWQRHVMTPEAIADTWRALRETEPPAEVVPESAVSYPWEFFAGIPETTLVAALALLEDDQAYAEATAKLGGLLTVPTSDLLLAQVKGRITAAKDPATLLGKLPLRIRLELTEGETRAAKTTSFALVKQEEAAVLGGAGTTAQVAFSDYIVSDGGKVSYKSDQEEGATLTSRKAFFDVAYRSRKPAVAPATDGFFHLLVDAWQAPAEAKLGPLAQAARQVDGIFRLSYLKALGRFKGHDQAALKLLDFTRSKEEDDLRAVLQALGGIGTPRATQELVSALTRPNITPALQFEACAILAKQDVANLQNELRSAINDLSVTPNVDSGAWDVREAIAALLSPVTAIAAAPTSTGGQTPAISDQTLDQALSGKIAHYRELSSEVKRALRTSQFFHIQVSSDTAPESIDLSPVIDMQYKALELLFRETFEEACSRLIHKGVLQRRLDVIGYARPIPRSMDEFENYIAALPIVREIPFFSKFKLRKMLRAICQFRPGKRFTLDGLKAFALFFLCFGRSECRYGLAGLFPLGFKGDQELYEFCKALHMQQDVRNRAAHEGFHPDASSDIDGIWRATAEIVQTGFKAKAFVDELMQNEYSPRNRSSPVIEKKVS